MADPSNVLSLLRPSGVTTAYSPRRHLPGLAWTLIRTDFKARYHGGSASGFVWALLKPLALFLVLFGVFRFLFPQRTYVFDLMVALTLWDFFNEGTRAGMESLLTKGFLISKVKVPLWIVVATSLGTPVIRLLASSVAVVAAIGLLHGWASPGHIALFALYLVLYAVIVFGFSLGASVLFLRYRDLNQFWDLALQAGFFLAPIVYPIEVFPERIHAFFYLWPVTPVVQFARSVLVENVTPSSKGHLLLVCEAIVVVVAGTVIFKRLGRRAVERL